MQLFLKSATEPLAAFKSRVMERRQRQEAREVYPKPKPENYKVGIKHGRDLSAITRSSSHFTTNPRDNANSLEGSRQPLQANTTKSFGQRPTYLVPTQLYPP